jgi:predicted secreted protein
MNATDARDLDSTLIRRATNAATFTEMAEFAESIESRPLDKLLADLPGLATLSDTKFSLARQVIRRRARQLADADLEQLRTLAIEIAISSPTYIGSRISSIF